MRSRYQDKYLSFEKSIESIINIQISIFNVILHGMKLTGQKARLTCSTTTLLAVSLLMVSGCGYIVDQEGELTAAGLDIEGCDLDSPYQLHLDFVGFDDCYDILYLRLQRGGAYIAESDGLEIQIHNLDEVRKQLESGPTTLEIDGSDVRVTVYFNRACPDSYLPLEAGAGTLTIEEMSLKSGGKLVLSASFDLVDLRTQEVVGHDVALSMDAEISTSSPYKGHTYCL